MFKHMRKIVIWSAIALVSLFILNGAFTTIPPGHAGVIYRFGAVQPDHKPEGFHFKIPFADGVEKMDIRLGKAEDLAEAASSDLQNVTTKVAVHYSMVGPLAPRAYQQIGSRPVIEATLINPAIQESVKSVTARYTAEELITKRAEVKIHVREEITEFIASTLEEKNVPGALLVNNVAVTDFAFSPEFNRAIEQKVTAEQDALKAENEKIKRITQAEAANEERKLAADAAAYQVEVESVARAEAILREGEALSQNPLLLQLRLAERWDGELPMVNGGSNIPLINLDELSKQQATVLSSSAATQ